MNDATVALLVQVPRLTRIALKVEAARRDITISKLLTEVLDDALRHSVDDGSDE
jgi:hypothetical protein